MSSSFVRGRAQLALTLALTLCFLARAQPDDAVLVQWSVPSTPGPYPLSVHPLRDGGFEVAAVDPAAAAAAAAAEVRVGAALARGNGSPVASSTLQQAIAAWYADPARNGEPGLFPLVDHVDVDDDDDAAAADPSAGRPLVGFMRVTFERPSVLEFAPAGEHAAELRSAAAAAAAEQAAAAAASQAAADAKRTASEKKAAAKAAKTAEKEKAVADAAAAQAKLEADAAAAQAKLEADAAYVRKAKMNEWARARRDGDAFDFEAVFDDNSRSMGMTFDPEAASAVVSGVAPGSPAEAVSVYAGDQIVKLDDLDVSEMALSMFMRKLSKAPWPRTLYFSAPARVDEAAEAAEAEAAAAEAEEKGGGAPVLRLLSPDLAAGDVPIVFQSWGAPLEALGGAARCGPLAVVVQTPADGCKVAEALHADAVGDVILASNRGVCTFTAKALAATATAARVSLIVNSEDEPFEMPTGGAAVGKVADRGVAVVSVGAAFGAFAQAQHRRGVAVTGWVGGTLNCPPPPPPKPAGARAWDVLDGRTETGGRLVVQSPTETRTFSWVAANFGAAPETVTGAPVRLVVASPAPGCQAKEYTIRIKGAIVAVERGGGCGFYEKFVAAQKLGARGVVITNNADTGVSPTMVAAPETVSTFGAGSTLALAEFLAVEGMKARQAGEVPGETFWARFHEEPWRADHG